MNNLKRLLLVPLLVLTALAYSFSVSAQPTDANKDGGAPAATTTASSAAGNKDGGGAPATTTGEGGAAPAVGADDAGGPTGLAYVPTSKKWPPPPPPTPQQIAALEAMQKATDAYEQGARDYRDTVTQIIKLHYEEKKRTILAGLDREIATEKAELKKAREIAIQRLEEFIAKYSGANAQPEATPDAMYRLAALYEERARSEDMPEEDIPENLKPAIALYKRVIHEFPQYKELAGIYYFLGHALNDSHRIDEAQQVWRSLVCHNHYNYPVATDPKNPDVDSIVPMPQDNKPEYWVQWRRTYRDWKAPRKGNPETTYQEVYPADCAFLPQPKLRPGDDPKYVPEVWWQIGNWEFDGLDVRGGNTEDEPVAVWVLNRAGSAYQHALQFKPQPVHSVSLYKYAWTLFKQQRYEDATTQFKNLLLETDELEKAGQAVGDFRSEAYTYIASSLTNVDFKGPGDWEPFIARPDIVDTEPKPEVAEKKLHIAIDRVKDPAIIPQDKPWTIEVYKGLALEFRSLNHFNNAIETYELILKKWPMHPSACETQAAIAETYDQMLVTKKQGTPEYEALSAKALDARTLLATYIGTTPWTDANKENPGALQTCERLVRGGLRQAAAAHTNKGKAYLLGAAQASSDKEVVDMLGRSLQEYRLAALGWAGYLKQDENAPDAYESRFWLADAYNKIIRVQYLLYQKKPEAYAEPSAKDIDAAKAAAIDVRDSNEDDKYLEVAAVMVVEETDVRRDLEYARFDRSKGSQGIQRRTQIEETNPGTEQSAVVVIQVPGVVTESIKVRDDYVVRVPPDKDVNKNSVLYAFDNADVYFAYGQFKDAKDRFTPIYKEHCGKDEYGYRAWEKLISMAAKSHDIDEARKLADAEQKHSCVVAGIDPNLQGKASALATAIGQEAGYVDAKRKFIEACGRDLLKPEDRCDPVTDKNKKTWEEAAKLYEEALRAAPGRNEAPAAAMRAAFSWKQLGRFNEAIADYNLFIQEYGKEQTLNTLEKGDKAKGTPPDPDQYKKRVNFLQLAYDELGTTYYGFFNYTKAAETYDKIAANERFEKPKRKDAARNAMTLYNAIGQRDKMLAQYRIVNKLEPTADERANYDYLVADFDYRQWNKEGRDEGANKQARIQAQASLNGFYNANKGNAAAAKYALEAIWKVAKLRKAGGDTAYHDAFKNTIAAWDFMKLRGVIGKDGKSEALSPPFADYGAEAEFTLLDEEIHDKFDYETGHHNYQTMNAEQIMGKLDQKTGKFVSEGAYKADAKIADSYDQKLQHIVQTYPSLEFVPAAIARQGSLYDSLRTGLYYCAGKKFNDNLIPAQFRAVLTQMKNSGRDDLVDKASDIEAMIKEGWRNKRDQETNAADEVMVRRYSQAYTLAKAYNVKTPAVTRALGRLAYFTNLIGDDKMRPIVTNTTDPTDQSKIRKLPYTNGQFLQAHPGLTALPQLSGVAQPAP